MYNTLFDVSFVEVPPANNSTDTGLKVLMDAPDVPVGVTLTWDMAIGTTSYGNGASWNSNGQFSSTAAEIEDMLQGNPPYPTSGTADLCASNAANLISTGGTQTWTITGVASWANANIPDVPFTDSWDVIVGCMDDTACNYDETANVDYWSVAATCILPDGCTDPVATNYDTNALCDDGSCTFCGTDPDVVNATIIAGTNQSMINAIGNYSTVQWSEMGTIATNGANSLLTHPNQYKAYKTEFAYKKVGEQWSSWEQDNQEFSTITCGDVNRIIEDGLLLNPLLSANMFGPDDGRYDSGTKWKFRIRNLCINCENGGPLVTPWLTIPNY